MKDGNLSSVISESGELLPLLSLYVSLQRTEAALWDVLTQRALQWEQCLLLPEDEK